MRGILRPKRRRMWVPAMTAVVIMGAGVVWTASGDDGAKRGRVQTVPTDTVQLQVDEAYYEAVGPRLPGEIVGVPIQEDLEAVPVGGPRGKPGLASVLVYMEEGTIASAVERADVRAFVTQRGGVVKYEYSAVLPNVLNLRDIPESQVEALRNLPGVLRVERDEYHPNVLMLHDSTPLIRGLQSQITGAGYSADGSGVRICIVDTGIDSDHLMYADRIDTSKGYDFYNDDNNPEDDHGHGSHCSGIALGGLGLSWDPCGTGSMPIQGVAPAATLIGCKVLNSAGGGYDSDIIAGIDYCADQSASGAQADVISMSIGTGNYSGPCSHSWAVAANNAVANGVVVVAASGNNNYSNAMSSPACGADVIAVGATYKADYPTCENNISTFYWSNCTDYSPVVEDQIVCFSNESDYLDIAAPGAIIWSASNAAGGSSIVGMSGTSMACPHVAGLAALILDMDGTLTPAEVRTIVRDGAIDMGPAGFDRAYGYGRIDVIDSLALVGPECETNEDCDDGNECTDDVCLLPEGVCENTPVPDNTPCTIGGTICCSGTCTAPVCSVNADCDDGNECTTDTCTNPDTCSAACSNTPVADNTSCTIGGTICCGGSCTDPTCSLDSDCDDAEACTTDTCMDSGTCTAYCDNTWPACGPADGCCGPTCTPATDPDCVGCDNDGTCEVGEDCHNCPNDCFEGPGAVCGNGVCETADGEDCVSCGEDCNGLLTGKPDYRYCCGDGTANYGVTCTDPRCTGGGNTCTSDPAVPSCCGDGVCEGTEDVGNCAVDCGCTVPEDCDDSNECTDDLCVEGACQNPPVADNTPCSGGICCDGTCDAPVCSINIDCNDSESCTADTCYNGDTCAAYCENVWPDCGLSDGCCGPTCTPANDTDCECLPSGAPCTEHTECCSLKCLGNGTCK